MMAPVDMYVDDLSTGPSCGQIVICTIECGLGKPGCDVNCAAGASANEALKAGTLAVCAAVNCAGMDGGSGLTSTLACLLSKCQKEVAACDGLPI